MSITEDELQRRKRLILAVVDERYVQGVRGVLYRHPNYADPLAKLDALSELALVGAREITIEYRRSCLKAYGADLDATVKEISQTARTWFEAKLPNDPLMHIRDVATNSSICERCRDRFDTQLSSIRPLLELLMESPETALDLWEEPDGASEGSKSQTTHEPGSDVSNEPTTEETPEPPLKGEPPLTAAEMQTVLGRVGRG